MSSFLRGAAYTTFASAVNLLVNVAMVAILPLALSVDSYGYLQLYLLYATYVGILHFGLVDGVYLRLGGAHLTDLPKKTLTGELILLTLTQVLWGVAITLLTLRANLTPDRTFVLSAVAAVVAVTNIRFLFVYVLQATARFGAASASILADRLFLLAGVIGLYFVDALDLQSVIVLDVAGKALGALVALWACRRAFTFPPAAVREVWRQSLIDGSAGVRLLLANMASLLVIGIFRFGVEYRWDIATFGIVSLALALAGMFTVFFNAVSMVLFPYLRRLAPERLPSIHRAAGVLLSVATLSALVSFLPAWWFISTYLPEYQNAVTFLAILLPLIVFDGRVILLSNSFLKTIRAEGFMLRLNTITLGASVLLAGVSTILIPVVELAVWGVLLVIALRAWLAEYYLRGRLGTPLGTVLSQETVLVMVFVLSALLSLQHGPRWFLVYVASVVVWSVHHRRTIGAAVDELRGR